MRKIILALTCNDQGWEYNGSMTTAKQPTPEEVWAQLKISSSNYWAGRNGRDCPPAPSLRTINGKPVLGRYLDSFGCEALMMWARAEYRRHLNRILVTMAVVGGASLLDAEFLLVVVPVFLVSLWLHRRFYAKHFFTYYRINEEIQRSGGQPQWEPFDKLRLRFMRHNPNSVWP
jgi:hypothetical protein